MKLLLVLMFALSSCAGFNLAPDEFGVEYGRGDGEIEGFKSGLDSEETWVAVNTTWYVGRQYVEREMERQSELIATLMEAALASRDEPAPQPVIVCPREHSKEPEPPPVPASTKGGISLDTQEIMYGGFTLASLLTAYLKRRWIADRARVVRDKLRREPAPEVASVPDEVGGTEE